jgi:hypothetical protein
MVTPPRHCTSQGLGSTPPLATTVAAMCSNWEKELAESDEMLWGFFNIFRSSAGRNESFGRPVWLDLVPGGTGGPGYRPKLPDSVQGAGGRGAATGEPPQMGTSGSQRRGFRRTRAGVGGVPAVGGRGGVLVPQVARSAVSALRGWSGEPQKSIEIRRIGIRVVRGWSPPPTGHVYERISAQTPWIHPEPKIRV